MDANINAPMACAPVIRATIWPQIRRIVSPRIVICQRHHIVHQVSKHKTEILINANRQTKTTLQRNSNLRVTLFRSMRRECIYHGPKNVFDDFRTNKLVYQF